MTMNKITIPTILTATILVAGIFAFMPVEQASTVHTTIQDSQTAIKSVTSAVTAYSAADSATDSKVFTLDPNKAFVLEEIIITVADNDATSDGADAVSVIELTVDGKALGLTDFIVGTTGATIAGTEFLKSESEAGFEIFGASDKVAITIDAVADGAGGTITPDVTVTFVIRAPSDTTLGTVGVA